MEGNIRASLKGGKLGGLDWIRLAESCERSEELSGTVKLWIFLDHLTNYYIQKNVSAACN
jgi:hypothetical protein